MTDKSPKMGPRENGASDDFQTPGEALWPLFPYLNKDWTIWECASGKGNLVREFEKRGYKVIASDILTRKDFLLWQPESFNCVVTNPPFSLKLEFLQRCYSLKKPFALLLPYTTFEGRKRQALFKEFGVECILFSKRISFETPSGKGGGAWFPVMWVTWGLGLPKELNFVDYMAPSQRKLDEL